MRKLNAETTYAEAVSATPMVGRCRFNKVELDQDK